MARPFETRDRQFDAGGLVGSSLDEDESASESAHHPMPTRTSGMPPAGIEPAHAV
jgi:hypothetical protein